MVNFEPEAMKNASAVQKVITMPEFWKARLDPDNESLRLSLSPGSDLIPERRQLSKAFNNGRHLFDNIFYLFFIIVFAETEAD